MITLNIHNGLHLFKEEGFQDESSLLKPFKGSSVSLPFDNPFDSSFFYPRQRKRKIYRTLRVHRNHRKGYFDYRLCLALDNIVPFTVTAVPGCKGPREHFRLCNVTAPSFEICVVKPLPYSKGSNSAVKFITVITNLLPVIICILTLTRDKQIGF